MTTKSRLRNLAVPVGLATLAAVLIGYYVVSYRNSVTHGAALVKVLAASQIVLWIGVIYFGRMLPYIGNAF